MTGFRALQQFAHRPPVQERCELCGKPLAEEHEHLLELEKRRLVCACLACAFLFDGHIGQRYKRVPSRIRLLPDFELSEAQWESLLIPINMAFFYRDGRSEKVIAMYPSPAGATESQLALETWSQLAAENPQLSGMQSDVEALLVNRLGERHGFSQNQYWLLPIDRCFKLVGLVRMRWRGFSGGAELWEQLAAFFDALAGRAEIAGGQHA